MREKTLTIPEIALICVGAMTTIPIVLNVVAKSSDERRLNRAA